MTGQWQPPNLTSWRAELRKDIDAGLVDLRAGVNEEFDGRDERDEGPVNK